MGAFVLAVVLHASWDGLNNLIAHVIIGVVSLTLLLVLIGLSQRRPRPLHPQPGHPGQLGQQN